MKTISARFLVLALMIGVSDMSRADGIDDPMYKLNGFGTLGTSHSSESMGDYVLNRTFPKGAGLSENWSFSNDSRFGMHMSSEFTPHISAVLQVIAEYNSDGNYRPSIEWLNLKYAFSPNFYVRAGRVLLPTFLNSETQDVGYSYPWIHPPMELFRQLIIASSDGVDTMYRLNFDEITNTFKATYGRNTADFPTSTETSKNLWGIFNTLEYDAVTVHGGYQQRHTSTLDLLTGTTEPVTTYSDLSLGASYDPGKWFVMSEWLQHESTAKRDAMYVGAGYRIGKFTPYATYSQDSQSSPISGASVTRVSVNSQRTASLGSRWDFMKNADLKLQYDQVRLSANSNGDLANVPAGVILYGTQFHVFSVVVDFVF